MRVLTSARIEFQAVDFAYRRARVLHGVSFEFEAGELAYLVGPSASGKTTLLRLAHDQLPLASASPAGQMVPCQQPSPVLDIA